MQGFKSRDEAMKWISRRTTELAASDVHRDEIATILSNELSARCGMIIDVYPGDGENDFNIILPIDAVNK
jgi:hypothetical protein